MDKEFIEEIILELSYRVSSGIPDLKNEDHLLFLREILEEKGLSFDVIENVIDNLREKRLLTELASFGGPTRSFAIDFDGTHSSGSLNFDFKNYDPEIKEPVQDDEAEAEDEGDEPVKEESYVPTYIFDADKMEIVETGNIIPKSDVLSENKFKCFMTGEVFLETTNGTLVKELDYLDSEIEDEDNINEIEFSDESEFEKYNSQHKMRDTTVVTISGKETTAGEVGKTQKKGEPVSDKPSEPKDKEILSPEKKKELRSADHERADHVLSYTKTEYAEREKQGKEDVGAGTHESRAGEAATHYAIRQMKEGKSREEIKAVLMEIANKKDTYLDSKWVDAALNATDKIINLFGMENINEVVWDTPFGRELIDTEGHDTSSDMFITTKDGRRIGVSLKQSGKVFLSNNGYAKSLDALIDNLSDEEKTSIKNLIGSQAHNEDIRKHIEGSVGELKGDLSGLFKKTMNDYKKDPDLAKKVFGTNYKDYLKVLDDFDSIAAKIEAGENLKGKEIKALAKVIGKGSEIYDKRPDLYDNMNLADNRATQRLLNEFNENPKFAMNMKRFIMDKVHITDILNLKHNPKLDEFVTIYGEPPDGIDLSKDRLLELFGEKTNKLYEIKEEFQKAKTPDDRKKKAAQVMKQIENSIYVDFKDGARTGEIKIKHEDGKEYPIFTVAVRARGLGSAPALEIYQADYMTTALKNGSFDIKKWTPKERTKFLTKLKAEYQEKLKDNAGNPTGISEIEQGIKRIDEKLKEK